MAAKLEASEKTVLTTEDNQYSFLKFATDFCVNSKGKKKKKQDKNNYVESFGAV